VDTARRLRVVVDGNVDQPLPLHATLNLLEAVDWGGIHKLLTYRERGYGPVVDGVMGGSPPECVVPQEVLAVGVKNQSHQYPSHYP